jgi:hypothetical protein
VATLTKPSGSGVIDLANNQSKLAGTLKIIPIATSGENDTMDMRVVGWERAVGTDPTKTLWIPHILGQFTCTLSAKVGVAGALVVATERFADTIVTHATVTGAQAKTTDTDGAGAASTGTILITSPANDLIAHIEMPTFGCELIELLFDTTAGGTTAMNALVKLLDC